jgi:hypothetical protein
MFFSKLYEREKVFSNIPKIKILWIFLLSFLLRSFILILGYSDINIFFHGANLNFDAVVHAYLVIDVYSGKFFYHEVLNSYYSPVTPFILGLIAIPLNLIFDIHVFYGSMIAISIIGGLETVGIYLLLNEFKLDSKIVIAFAIINPWITIGVLHWGGYSMIITSTCIVWIMYLYRQIDQNYINIYKGWAIIMFLVLISASVHRTGAFIQIVVWFIWKLITVINHNNNLQNNNLKQVTTNTSNEIKYYLGHSIPVKSSLPLSSPYSTISGSSQISEQMLDLLVNTSLQRSLAQKDKIDSQTMQLLSSIVLLIPLSYIFQLRVIDIILANFSITFGVIVEKIKYLLLIFILGAPFYIITIIGLFIWLKLNFTNVLSMKNKDFLKIEEIVKSNKLKYSFPELNTLEIVYLISNLVFFFVPLKVPDSNMRFLFAINSLLILFYCYVHVFIKNIKNERNQIVFNKLYLHTTIVILVLSPIIAWLTVRFYIAQKWIPM